MKSPGYYFKKLYNYAIEKAMSYVMKKDLEDMERWKNTRSVLFTPTHDELKKEQASGDLENKIIKFPIQKLPPRTDPPPSA